jgi:hypothetical protein
VQILDPAASIALIATAGLSPPVTLAFFLSKDSSVYLSCHQRLIDAPNSRGLRKNVRRPSVIAR